MTERSRISKIIKGLDFIVSHRPILGKGSLAARWAKGGRGRGRGEGGLRGGGGGGGGEEGRGEGGEEGEGEILQSLEEPQRLSLTAYSDQKFTTTKRCSVSTQTTLIVNRVDSGARLLSLVLSIDFVQRSPSSDHRRSFLHHWQAFSLYLHGRLFFFRFSTFCSLAFFRRIACLRATPQNYQPGQAQKLT